ncbi:MAG: peptidase m41, partial [Polaromonas sp.]|nr:peptidase m41 [Polaromonas sp.]
AAPAGKPPHQFKLDAWDAQELKRMLKLKAPLMEVMQWPPARIEALMLQFQQSHDNWETDYSKLLIFVCGNLDEMYRETASRVEDCDTDADIFHQLTRKLSLIDVKKALAKRFRPEQIARLGNQHLIYPSFSRATYERLIAQLAGRYVADIARNAGVRLDIGQEVLDEIYRNAVFPAQGTRPLFSSVHAILSANLVRAALWALEQGVPPDTVLRISLDSAKQHLCASAEAPAGMLRQKFAVALELNRLKQRANADFRALLAVHEAGHGLIYSLLFGRAPQEIKINIASFEGGYNSFSSLKARTRQNCLDMVCVGLAGRLAEEMVFGEMACTTGAEQDYKQATEEAARYIRHHGFGGRISRTDVTRESEQHLNTDIAPSNAAIEALLQEQQARTRALLALHRRALTAMAEALQAHGFIDKQGMATLMAAHGTQLAPAADADEPLVLEPFAERLARFVQGM